MSKDRILITGANGQIGTVLTEALTEAYGLGNVITSDIKEAPPGSLFYEKIDVSKKEALAAVVKKYDITQIYHLAAILSARGERFPKATWEVNMGGLFNILEIGCELGVSKVCFPSSIAAFGDDHPQGKYSPECCPQTNDGVRHQQSCG